jgi:hypothetical protein
VRRIASVTICLLILLIVACDRQSTLTPPAPKSASDVSIGEVHTEFLENLFSKHAKVNTSTNGAIRNTQAARSQFLDMCLEAANETAEKYGGGALTAEDVRTFVEMGERLAQTSTEFDMRQVLRSRKAQEWWDRYSNEATAETPGRSTTGTVLNMGLRGRCRL